MATPQIIAGTTAGWAYQRGVYQGELDKLNTNNKPVADYITLQTKISTYINTYGKDANLNGELTKNGRLQETLVKQEQLNKDLKADVETAQAQDELLRSRNTKRNSHTLFLLNRPVRTQMIPILWVISVAFVGIALILVRMIAPQDTVLAQGFGSFYFYFMELISSPTILAALLGAAIIVIIFLSLKVAKVIP
jgi:hypothetical protein